MKFLIFIIAYANLLFAYAYKPKDCASNLPKDVSVIKVKGKYWIRKEVSTTHHIDFYFNGNNWVLDYNKALLLADSCLLKQSFFNSGLK